MKNVAIIKLIEELLVPLDEDGAYNLPPNLPISTLLSLESIKFSKKKLEIRSLKLITWSFFKIIFEV